jgi:hypothetical protein
MKSEHIDALDHAPAGGADYNALPASADPKLRVTVIHTTLAGTVAALRAAADLAKHLGGRLSLLAPEVVPFLLPLEEPNVAIEFLKKRYCGMVASAGLLDEEVTIRILLCRDRVAALKLTLAPRSLIVVGGSTRWWKRSEHKLARSLRKMGHHVVFVDSTANELTKPEAGELGQAEFLPVPEKGTRGRGGPIGESRKLPGGKFSSGNRGMGGLNRA